MELKQEIIEDLKKITPEQGKKLAADLSAKWQKWDNDRDSQITVAQKIMQEVYLQQPRLKYEDGLEWKSDVKLSALYNIKRTKKSMLWQALWSNPEQMFDVRGTDERTEQNAKAQKAAIVESLNKMKIGKQYDKAVDNLYDIGEMIFKVDWEQRKKVVKRQRKDVGFVLMNVLRNISGAGFLSKPIDPKREDFNIVELPYYENARVESINPLMFVFDHTKWKIGDLTAWDSLIKIYKRFDTLENIQNNRVYKITPQILDELGKENDNADSENKEITDLRDKNEYGGMYSVLYCHGDFRIGGRLYKNYIAEVLAGKFLIRFEENPMYINPFTMPCAMSFDPLTKRGITDLKSALDLLKAQEKLTNTAFDIQQLRANPPAYAGEDTFDSSNTDKNGCVVLAPGKITKVKNGLDGNLPVPYTISGEGISDLLAMCKQTISDLTSVSNFMFGNETNKRDVTATELSLMDKGASSQYSKEMDIINSDVTMPIVEKVAELLAMFKDGVDFIYYQEKGKNIEYKITNEIRQAQYEYFYEDRNALEDRKSKLEQLYQVFVGAAQLPELAQQVDWKEVLVTYVEGLGWDNTDKFFKEPTPANQFAEQLNQIPPEMQEQIVGYFGQELQQFMQWQQQQEQQTQMQQQAQNQV